MSAKLLIVSTSKIHGSGYMEYMLDDVANFFKGATEIIFIPYARPSGISHDEYTAFPKKVLENVGINVKGLHEFEDPKEALQKAQGIFTGGGNTFVLLKTLYDLGLVEILKEVVKKGTPYMGSSAGSNITGLTIGTSNDMPIAYPPSFDALQLVPFNINPHYQDPDTNSKHQGETRETRIKEFHFYNTQAVIGLREGSWLKLENAQLVLSGKLTARLFESKDKIREVEPGDVSFLLEK